MPGQGARLAFNGNVGQVASAQFISSNFENCYNDAVEMSIVDPNGITVVPPVVGCGGAMTAGPVTLATAGTYTLVVAPSNGNTGVANVELTLQ
jgi:hypothetical protein